jgi:hypothetical protein
VVIRLERGSNRLLRFALHAGFAPRAFALLETMLEPLVEVEHDRGLCPMSLGCLTTAGISVR